MFTPKVIQNQFIPFKGYDAITLFGVVFTRDRSVVTKTLLNHERIHCAQQREWLYLPFYIMYIVEWLWYFVHYRDSRRAYRAISFEREAYAHQHDSDYLSHRRHYANYKISIR